MPCLDDNLAVEFAAGMLSGRGATQVEVHLAGCQVCRTLVAAIAPRSDELVSDIDIATAPRVGTEAPPLPPAPLGSARASSDPAIAPGELVGRYLVLRRVGAGGMGVVYAAYDPQLDRKVALKLLRTRSGLGESEARARLVREAQAIARLSHPGVVAVYDAGTAASGEVYVAMEFVDGDTLGQWLAGWPRSWRDILEVFREAGRGLAAAHAVGLLHRDFKPDNVLVGADHRVRVTDFGLARSFVVGADELDPSRSPDLAGVRASLTATGAILGTPRYMAPEQLAGGEVAAAADQFSFCVALYEALFGVHPLVGGTAAAMLERGVRAQPPPSASTVPAWIAEVLARGLDPHPAKRFPSMNALLAELAPRAPRRDRRPSALFAVGLAVALGGVAAATVLIPGEDPRSADGDQVRRLESEIKELLAQRDSQLERLEDLRKTGERDSRRLNAVIGELASKTQRIEQLEAEIRTLSSAAPAPSAASRKPALPRGGGLGIGVLRATLGQARPELSNCLAEWIGRRRAIGEQPKSAAMNLHLRLLPDGQVQETVATGLEDVVARECMTMALERQTWSPSSELTVANVSVRLDQGQVAVAIERLGSEPAPPRRDMLGE